MTSPYLLGIRLVAVLVSAGLVVSCATGKALQKGESSAIAGDWDSAVEHYRRASARHAERITGTSHVSS
jgi:hypothetical protein